MSSHSVILVADLYEHSSTKQPAPHLLSVTLSCLFSSDQLISRKTSPDYACLTWYYMQSHFPTFHAQGVADANSNAIIGHGLSFLVGRVSYTFGLQVGRQQNPDIDMPDSLSDLPAVVACQTLKW